MANDLVYTLFFFGRNADANMRAAAYVRANFGETDGTIGVLTDATTVEVMLDGSVGHGAPWKAIDHALASHPGVGVVGTWFEVQNAVMDVFCYTSGSSGYAGLLGSNDGLRSRRSLRKTVEGVGDAPKHLQTLIVDDALSTHRGTYRPELYGARSIPDVLRHLVVALVAWPFWLHSLLRCAATANPFDEGYTMEAVLLATGGLSVRGNPPNGFYAPARTAFDVHDHGELAVWRQGWSATPVSIVALVGCTFARVLIHIAATLSAPMRYTVSNWIRERRCYTASEGTLAFDETIPF